MARYPRALWKPLPEAGTEPLITATQVILHTAVSPASSLFGYFSRADVTLESHFYVNQTGVEQYIDTGRQADANRTANVRAISIETWDNADPNHTPWTPTQMGLLVDLVAWACRTHGIPARQCPTHDAPGIGWHVMFGAPGPWTPVSKSCPGRPRIAQMPELIRRVQAALAGEPQEDNMPTIAELNAAARAGQLDDFFARANQMARHPEVGGIATQDQAASIAGLIRDLSDQLADLQRLLTPWAPEHFNRAGELGGAGEPGMIRGLPQDRWLIEVTRTLRELKALLTADVPTEPEGG